MFIQPDSRQRSDLDQTSSAERYLRLPEILERVGVSWRTLLRWEREGRFPRRYKIGPRVVAWKQSEVDQWFADQSVAPSSTKEAK